MKCMLKRSLALVLCAALMALGLSALLFSWHCCDHGDCAVCLAIGASLRLTRAALVLEAAAVSAVLLSLSGRETGRRAARRTVTSLVLMKTELLN